MKPTVGLICCHGKAKGGWKNVLLKIMVIGCVGLLVVKVSSRDRTTDSLISSRANQASSGSKSSPANTVNSDDSQSKPCQPVRNFVFLKTMKTGGSTVASILHRYALKNNLVAVTAPEGRPSILPDKSHLEPGLKYLEYNCSDFPGYNYMASHIHYNRQAMDAVVHNAKYFTILRSPYDQRRSQFYYTKKDKKRKYATKKNPFAAHLKELQADYIYDGRLIRVMRNGTSQFHTLGFLPKYHSNDTAVRQRLRELESELDMVMLMEYFDESVVLLARTLCWRLEDFAYSFCKLHKEKPAPLTTAVREMVARLNPGDVKLYDYFNRTFWKRVEEYEGDFEGDLGRFRRLQRDTIGRCEEENWKTEQCIHLGYDAHQLLRRIYNKQLQWICPRNSGIKQVPLRGNGIRCKYHTS